jgi:hypothetical protein
MTKLFVALRVDHFLQRQLLEITFTTNLNTEPVEGRDKRHHGLSARRRMNRQPRSYIQQILATLIWVVPVVLGLTTFDVTAADWPEHLTLHEESRSPDGHYGIVVTTSSHVDDATTFLIPEEARSSSITLPIYKRTGSSAKSKISNMSRGRIIAIWRWNGHPTRACVSHPIGTVMDSLPPLC